jgi:glutaredoxin-dependent peroxiredoxin
MIQPGQLAPDFSLYNTEKQAVTLSQLKGKNVVLLFVPHAFTGVCTKELCHMRDHLHDYTDLNAEIFGISVDSLHVLKKWKELEGFNFELLSDFNKETSTAYNSLYEVFGLGLKGVSKRSAFVIDKEGVIRYAEILDNPGEVPNFEDIKATLAGLN